MGWLEALILGIVQGLTEFLPVSSSGHLEIGKVLLGVDAEKSLTYTVVVHGATVLSTIVVFRKDIFVLLKGLFAFKWNDETKYILKLIVSMIPVAFLGYTFADEIELFFNGNLLLVGSMLIITALLLTFSYYSKRKERPITFVDSFVIGIAQALAVMPGISRSGATISTGLMLGNKKDGIAKFSFLMVLVPIIGANLKDLLNGKLTDNAGVGVGALIIGFLAAFISGLLACKWMIGIVKKGKLIYFAIYCLIVGLAAISYNLFF
ncbi:MAG: undecaprenyl-diphosphate phosphatase [Bacteroidales bacterium]|nr:undecaprenyl-diphosphate phosphatase [Bacteroidales bacterium]